MIISLDMHKSSINNQKTDAIINHFYTAFNMSFVPCIYLVDKNNVKIIGLNGEVRLNLENIDYELKCQMNYNYNENDYELIIKKIIKNIRQEYAINNLKECFVNNIFVTETVGCICDLFHQRTLIEKSSELFHKTYLYKRIGDKNSFVNINNEEVTLENILMKINDKTDKECFSIKDLETRPIMLESYKQIN